MNAPSTPRPSSARKGCGCTLVIVALFLMAALVATVLKKPGNACGVTLVGAVVLGILGLGVRLMRGGQRWVSRACGLSVRVPAGWQINEIQAGTHGEVALTLPNRYAVRLRPQPNPLSPASYEQLRADTIAHVQSHHQGYTPLLESADVLLYSAVEDRAPYVALIARRVLKGTTWVAETNGAIFDDQQQRRDITEAEARALVALVQDLRST